jgi:hypothetical protein
MAEGDIFDVFDYWSPGSAGQIYYIHCILAIVLKVSIPCTRQSVQGQRRYARRYQRLFLLVTALADFIVRWKIREEGGSGGPPSHGDQRQVDRSHSSTLFEPHTLFAA